MASKNKSANSVNANNNQANQQQQVSSTEFLPKIYRFKFPPGLNENLTLWGLEEMNAIAPSFNHLFDHSIAVLWYIFYDNGKYLNSLSIADLTWTLRFLEAIDTRRIHDIDDHIYFTNYIKSIINSKYVTMDELEYGNLSSQLLDRSIQNTSSYYSYSIEDYFRHREIAEMALNEEMESVVESNTNQEDPRDVIIKEAAQKLTEWVEGRQMKISMEDKHRKSMEELINKLERI